MTYSLDDYQTVDERIAEFYKANPKGALRRIGFPQPWKFGDRDFIAYTAGAWRDSKSEEPDGVGTAWEPVPGPTQFTRDSELMNAETAAWGRAIIACGAATAKKGIASREEVRNRSGAGAETPVVPPANQGARPLPPTPSPPSLPAGRVPAVAAAISGPQSTKGTGPTGLLKAALVRMHPTARTRWLEEHGFTTLTPNDIDAMKADEVEALLAAATGSLV